ncbi:MAG: hypothetical protein GF315_09385 [candidate division Zixibacteria bacterium]|nr:hypothetical protein [candidate division Zixibacteria bacterium]
MKFNSNIIRLILLIVALIFLNGFNSNILGGFPIDDDIFGLIMYGKKDTSQAFFDDLSESLQMNAVWFSPVGDTAAYRIMKEMADDRGMLINTPGSEWVNGDFVQVPTNKYCKAYKKISCSGTGPVDKHIPDLRGIHHLWGDSVVISDTISVWKGSADMDSAYCDSELVLGPRYSLMKGRDYVLDYKIAVGSGQSLDDTTTLAFVVISEWTLASDTITIVAVTRDSIPDDSVITTIHIPFNTKNLTRGRREMEMKVFSTLKRDIFVQELEIYEEDARELMVDSIGWGAISEQLRRYNVGDDTTIMAVWAQDEPPYYMFGPYGLIQKIVSDSLAGAANPDVVIKGAHIIFPRTFVDIAKPKWLHLDLYPFGPDCSDTCLYYGSKGHAGLQSHLNQMTRYLMLNTRYALDQAQHKPEKVYQTLMAFGGGENDWKRRPTASELRCTAGIGLAAGVDGQSVFLYASGLDTHGDSTYGLTNTDGSPRDSLYYTLRDNIAPLVRSIEKEYLLLDWKKSYRISPDSAQTEIGKATLIDTVTWWTDTTAVSNPDAGWFQVTEFRDTTLNANCLLVVNRACNNQFGVEAPPIYASVVLNIDHFVSRRYQVVNVDGRMNEKYVIYNEDNELKFTTMLEAGEAKLFRIENVNR